MEHHFMCHLPFVCPLWASLVAQILKNLPTMQDSSVWSLGWEDSLEKEMATHSSILAWRIPWTWWATVLGVKKSWTWLRDFHSLFGEISILVFLSILFFSFLELYDLFVYFANYSLVSLIICKFSPLPYVVFSFCLRLPSLWKILSAWLGPIGSYFTQSNCVFRKIDMTSAAGRLWTDGCLYSVLPHPCQVLLL